MAVTILKDICVSIGKIESYFDGVVPINLWRAMNIKNATSIFAFQETPIILSNGRPRPADIKIEVRDNIKWVCIKNRPRGVSTFDQAGIPSGKNWQYFKIPKGTYLPYGLAIVKDEFNTKFKATHYTIAPAFDMPLNKFKILLEQLALKVIKEVI